MAIENRSFEVGNCSYILAGEGGASSRGKRVIAMSSTIDAVRNQRLELLHALLDAWMRQVPGQQTDFQVSEKGAFYVIRHPELRGNCRDFEVPRDDIDALVKTGYLSMEGDQGRGFSIVRIPYQGFDVFDAQLGERAKPEFERRVIFDVEGEQSEPAVRAIDIRGHAYTLTASPRPAKGDWAARVTRYSLKPGAPPFQQAILDHRSLIHDQAAILNTMRASGSTAASALNDLEVQLHSAVEQALGIHKPGGSNG